MGGEFNTYLQIAGHLSGDSGDFNTVPEVRSLPWTGIKSLQHVKEKVFICFILSESFSKPGHPLNLVPFCENLIFYCLEFVCTYLDFHLLSA